MPADRSQLAATSQTGNIQLLYRSVVVDAAERTKCIRSADQQTIVCLSSDYPYVVLTCLLFTSTNTYSYFDGLPASGYKYLRDTSGYCWQENILQ